MEDPSYKKGSTVIPVPKDKSLASQPRERPRNKSTGIHYTHSSLHTIL